MGTGIFTDMQEVDFYGINGGKYTVRPMDPMGLEIQSNFC